MTLVEKVYPSDVYSSCDELWIVTCYFNPSGYQTKLQNYKTFERVIRNSNLNLLTVECVFDDWDFELAPSKNVLRVRANSIMWLKENLLNMAIGCLPSTARKVVWSDCDILFTNPNWAVETASLLDDFPIVQPYQRVIRLPRSHTHYQGQGDTWKSFAYIWNTHPQLHNMGNFRLHGHTGMAWAARLELLKKHGLYHGCISGSGDHLMAHAMCGTFKDPCVERIVGPVKIRNPFFRYFLNWAYPFYQEVKGNIQYVPGDVLHLWHGEIENRQYLQRHKELRELGFDPYKDLRLGDNGIWEWNSSKKELHEWAKKYFQLRLEDG
jgi:hypothetical protein